MYLVSRFQKIHEMLLFFVILIFRLILVGKGLLSIYASNLIILVVCVNTMFTVFLWLRHSSLILWHYLIPIPLDVIFIKIVKNL